MISRFVANSEKCRKYTFLGGSAQIITILQRGGYQNLLQNYMGGGLPDLLQYYKGEGGSLGTPNLYYVIYGRPLNSRLAGQLGHTAIVDTARPPVFAQTPAFKLKIACIFTRIGRRQLPVQRVVNTAFDI